MKIAVVYDYIPPMGGGAERVLLDILAAFPQSDLFIGAQVVTEFSNAYIEEIKLKFPEVTLHIGRKISAGDPFSFRFFHYSLPQEMQQFSFEEYDTIVCYTSFLAHTIKGGSRAKKIIYMNTPARMLWHLSHSTSTLKMLTPKEILTVAKSPLLLQDIQGMRTADKVFCISHAVKERIFSSYNQAAEVIYPSVHFPEITDSITAKANQMKEIFGNYFLHISRIESYKNIDSFVVAAEKDPKSRTFIVAGHGPYFEKLLQNSEKRYGVAAQTVYLTELGITAKKIQNTYFLGNVSEEIKWPLITAANATFSLNDEDFGITKVESLAMGTPVIGTNEGATPEVIEHTLGGILLSDSSVQSILTGIEQLEQVAWDTKKLRAKAEEFTPDRFISKIQKLFL